jgi:hypothetical protein
MSKHDIRTRCASGPELDCYLAIPDAASNTLPNAAKGVIIGAGRRPVTRTELRYKGGLNYPLQVLLALV